MKKALIITHTGFQDHELVYPYYRLLGEGFETHIVADKKDSLGRCYGIFGLNMPCHIVLSDFVENAEFYFTNYDTKLIFFLFLLAKQSSPSTPSSRTSVTRRSLLYLSHYLLYYFYFFFLHHLMVFVVF